MSAVFACGQSNEVAVSRLRAAAFALLSLAGSGALAAEDEMPAVVLAQANLTMPGERNRPQLEVNASTLPRFDNIDGSLRTSRIDMTWLPPRRSALGLSVGMVSLDSPTLAPFAPRPGFSPSSVDLGLHWRYTLDSNYRVDVTAWRRLMPPDALTLVQTREPAYGARVEMQLGSSLPKNGFVAERGFLGLQLESGARVTLRRSGGKPMVYYRSKF
jgi:hypothetical protein